MAKRLTVKEAKLVKAKVAGKSNREAYQEVYSATAKDTTAAQNTTKILQKPHVKEAFERALEKANITEERLALKLSEGLDATRAVVMGKESSDSFVDVQPDFAIRHKYLETALKVKGIGQSNDPNTTVNNFGNLLMQQKDRYSD